MIARYGSYSGKIRREIIPIYIAHGYVYLLLVSLGLNLDNIRMATLLIRTNGCEADEVEDIYQLLDAHNIDFYQTDAGRWGFSVAGFWLHDSTQLQQAQRLLADYQQQRYQRVHEEYETLRQSGQADSFLRRIAREPLMILIYILMILGILYLTISPFLQLMD